MTNAESCPEESVFLALAAGHLSQSARLAFEQHIDHCADCSALVGTLASLSDSKDELTHDDGGACAKPSQTEAPCSKGMAILSSAALLMAQLVACALVWWSPLPSHFGDYAAARLSSAHTALLGYALCVGPLGCIVGIVSLVAQWRSQAPARRLLRAQAWLALGTIALAPLSLVVLDATRKPPSR